LPEKLSKYPNFYYIYPKKINKIPDFHMIFARKMPEFYIIIAREIFFPNLVGDLPSLPLPVSYGYDHRRRGGGQPGM